MLGIVTDGLQSPFLITQGYGIAATTISISPFAPVVAVSSVTHFVASVASDWILTGSGSLAVAMDGLSADYTAPGSAAIVTIKATDQSNPGNEVTTPVTVTSFGPITQGEVSDMIGGMNPIFGGRSVVDIGRN